MKIYTRTGDSGATDLCCGHRVEKDHDRVEACGTVDELNAAIGLVRAEELPREVEEVLDRISNELFNVGGELAMRSVNPNGAGLVTEDHVKWLEANIDHFQENLKPLTTFILPGGTRASAAMHFARTVCRRAERRSVTLARNEAENVPSAVLTYLNRLGDLLFVLGRVVNAALGREDIQWHRDQED